MPFMLPPISAIANRRDLLLMSALCNLKGYKVLILLLYRVKESVKLGRHVGLLSFALHIEETICPLHNQLL